MFNEASIQTEDKRSNRYRLEIDKISIRDIYEIDKRYIKKILQHLIKNKRSHIDPIKSHIQIKIRLVKSYRQFTYNFSQYYC
ncbi:hypothetical protein pb186bvf_017410 [Paramecium bursaria]